MSVTELDEKTAENYRVTIRWYLSWCRKSGLGCTVASAKDFVDWAHKEKAASDWMVERWKEAIRWFFVAAKTQSETRKVATPSPNDIEPNRATTEKLPETNPSKEWHKVENFAAGERIEAANPEEEAILSAMRRRGMALRTERSYLSSYRDYSKRHPKATGRAMCGDSVKAYLEYLAMERAISSSTQKIALNALVFIAREAFEVELGEFGDFVRAKNRKRIPVVMSQSETKRFFSKLKCPEFGGREIL